MTGWLTLRQPQDDAEAGGVARGATRSAPEQPLDLLPDGFGDVADVRLPLKHSRPFERRVAVFFNKRACGQGDFRRIKDVVGSNHRKASALQLLFVTSRIIARD